MLRIFQPNVAWMPSLVPAIPRMRRLLNERCAGRTKRAIDAGKSGPGKAKAVWRAHMQRGARSCAPCVETGALQSDIAKSHRNRAKRGKVDKIAKRGKVDRALCSVAH